MRVNRCIIVVVPSELNRILASRGLESLPPWRAVAAIALLIFTVACAESATVPSSYASFSQIDLVVGTGTEAASGKTVTMNYTGWLYDSTKTNQRGAQFDSTTGKTPFSFVLGSDQVISGWDQGVPGMKVGGVRRLVIPPSLAYGGTRQGPIPPNATLLFEIALLDVQ
jgi:FKBP-type peptidyl-prolyl cis-trans isomerase FkpA